MSQLFFDLPHEKKMKLGLETHKNHRGYFPLKEEALSTTGDLKEGLDLGPDHIKRESMVCVGQTNGLLRTKTLMLVFKKL